MAVATGRRECLVTICLVQKNEAPYLLEWIAFHLNAGADHIQVYDNDSSDPSPAILDAIAQKFPVSVVGHPTVAGQSPQRTAYRDALALLRERSEFVAFIDADEFLFCPDGTALHEALREYPDDISAVGINQRLFGSNGEEAYRTDLVTARFIRRAPIDYPAHGFFKTIARPARVVRPDVHNMSIASGRYAYSDGSPLEVGREHPGKATRIATGPVALHHYQLKSRQEFEVKRRRGGSASSDATHRRNRYATADFDSMDASMSTEIDETLARLAGRTRRKMREIYDAVHHDLPDEARALYEPLL